MASALHILIDAAVAAIVLFHPGRTIATTTTSAPPALSQIRHVFIVVLENEDNDVTFGPQSQAPYLSKTLVAQGAYLQNYYGIGHFSLDNYVALISGQAPNQVTQLDCQQFVDFKSSGVAAQGQAIGQGCVYPASVRTIGDELTERGLRWRSYNEDMGNDPARENATCGHPALGSSDATQHAEAPTLSVPQGDQYATRHNPFMYFHSVIDSPSCADEVVPLTRLPYDLAASGRTPNLVFITPNLCSDGHDATCVTGRPGGLAAADAFLAQWIPMILESTAYKRDGLLLILFDESEMEVNFDIVANKISIIRGDARACCDEQSGPNVKAAGQIGPGGGNTGAVALSPHIKPGTVSQTPYNHYSTLRTIEAIFGLPYLGYAGAPGLAVMGNDIFSR
ncbi:MAG: phosphoesterase [Candidatus Eremiobacteraeota bacterium]|nr:phosphoesterase [Candidatus Eremiobacteraeota bacterium]